MGEVSVDDLRQELATLEAAETRISAERRRLHHQIDYGFATAATHAREREVSDERQRLHQRIDSLRELLRAKDPVAGGGREPAALEPLLSPLSQWSGVSPEAVAAEDGTTEELEL